MSEVRMMLLFGIVLAPAPATAAWFIRGDANASGDLDLADAVKILFHLFQGQEVACLRAADVNDDGKLEVADAVALLGYLFQDGPGPGAPSPECGYDPQDDTLSCRSFPPCASQGVFLCLDRSGSVCTQDVFGRIKADARKAIGQLAEGDQFAIIFFSTGFGKYPPTEAPADATALGRAGGLAFIDSSLCGSGSCPLPALLASLDYAERSTAAHKAITFVSDGTAACAGFDPAAYMAMVLEEVAARNTARIRIDTVGIGYAPNVDEAWMQELASQNGGNYTPIIFR